MTLIALTGGIASGKSTIAARFVEHGAHLIDADQLAREVVNPGEETLDRIVAAFGTEVLQADGSLDRAKLGSLVFERPEQLNRLNDIIHPAIRRRGDEQLAAARAEDPAGVIIYDIPLLVEGKNDRGWNAVVVAEAPESVRIERMITLRGMTEAEARARIASQASNAERRAIADHVIDTSGTLQWTMEQVDRIWHTLVGSDTQLSE